MLNVILLLLLCIYTKSEFIVYRAEVGSQLGIDNAISDINYTANGTYAGIVPTNLTVTPLNGAILIPIFYAEVYYLEYDVASNTTLTLYLDYCDPIPNRDQGNISYTERGDPICPTTYGCIVTELAPDENYRNWPDLRSCLLNFTILDRTDVPVINSGATVDTLVLDAGLTLDNPRPNVTTTFGIVDCNDFISRSLNCQFAEQLNTYQLQCLTSPVPCYSRGIGKFFGAFWDQNPLYQYTLPRSRWTEAHWHGIASTLNNLTYYKDGVLADPLTPIILNNYFWIPDLVELEQETIDGELQGIPQFDVIQEQPYNWILGSYPPPATSSELRESLFSFVDCFFIFDQACGNVDWYNETSIFYRSSSYIGLLAIPFEVLLYSANVTTIRKVYGMELINAYGESCGKELREIEPGESVIFYCENAYAPVNSTFQLLIHGPTVILDVVGKGLAPPIYAYDDPLTTLLDYGVYAFNTFISLIANLAMIIISAILREFSAFKVFPSRVSPEAAEFLFGGGGGSPLYININYSSTGNQATYLSALSSVRNNILVNNTYPYNYPLANNSLFREFTTAPVNLSNPEHQDWLYGIWSTWYAPRQAGSEVSQCEFSNVGETIYPNQAPKQFWFNGQPEDPGYDIPPGTSEGGCLCNSTLPAMTDYQFFCAKCTEGFGPQDPNSWAAVLQSNNIVSTVLNTSSYTGFTLTSWTADQFKSELLCRFPMGPDPIAGSLAPESVCSGHGVLTYTETTDSIQLTEYFLLPAAVWTFPLCTKLYLYNLTADPSTAVGYNLYISSDPMSLLYYTGNSVITILDGSAVYLNQVACSFAQYVLPRQYSPQGILSCPELPDQILTCTNDKLYSTGGMFFSAGRLAPFNEWLGYFIPQV